MLICGRFILVFLVVLLLADFLPKTSCKRSYSGSSRSRSKSSSSSSSSGGGLFGWFGGSSSKTKATSTSTSHSSSYGWSVPNQQQKPIQTSTVNKGIGWQIPNQQKPVQTSKGWQVPQQSKPLKANQPSANIGPGGYPVQQGFVNSNRNPSAPYNPSQGTSSSFGTNNHNQRVSPPGYNHPPAYSPKDPMGRPPAYNSNYNKNYNSNHHTITNNNYYYTSPSQFGMSSQYYPRQNGFGYPAGHYSGGFQPSYHGTGLFSSGHHSYGYPTSGSWGMPSYGVGSSSGSSIKSFAAGAVTGYLANSLISRITNPWGYSGYGYGHGYMDRYRYSDDYYRRRETPTPAPPPPAKEDKFINCIVFDPESKNTLINPNCTCTFLVMTDPTTGENNTHHNCVPKYINGYLLASDTATAMQNPGGQLSAPPPQSSQAEMPVYGVNNPPPNFNGTVSAGGYGSGYGYGNVQNQGYGQPAPPAGGPEAVSQRQSDVNASAYSSPDQKKAEFYSKLDKFVDMGQFRAN